MFSIYGENGRAFKGAMDELRKLHAVGRVSRIRRIELQNPVQAVGLSAPTVNLPSAQAETTPQTPSRGAFAAYAQTAAAQMPRRVLNRVADVMSRQVLVVRSDMEIVSAWQALLAQRVGTVMRTPVTAVTQECHTATFCLFGVFHASPYS